MNTKDCSGFLAPLSQVADRLIAVAIPGEQNGLDPEVLAEQARDVGLRADVAGSVEEAIGMADETERLLICGSLYLAGSVLRRNG